jgi:hypothetical protein
MLESTAIPTGAVGRCSRVERGAAEEDVSLSPAAAVRCRRRLAGARMLLCVGTIVDSATAICKYLSA